MPRIIVVGAGVIGLCCAYELHHRGATVTVLDRDEPGAGCSAGNSGWIVPSLSTPLPAPGLRRAALTWAFGRDAPVHLKPRIDPSLARWLLDFWRCCNERTYLTGITALARLNRDTLALYDALQAGGIEFEMHHAGLLFVFRKPAGLRHTLTGMTAMAARCGYKSPQTLTAEEVHHLEPAVSRSIAGGLLIEEERHVRPESLAAGLVKRLHELGVEIRSGLSVTDIHARGNRADAITAGGHVFEADQFLIAAGVWSARLGKQIGCPLPIQAGAGYSVTVQNPRARLQHSLYLFEAKVACSPFHDALRVAGNLDLVGIDAAVDQRRIAAIRRSADNYLDNWQGTHEATWMGMRPLLPDGLPVIGRATGFDNVYFATGHGMLGITLAPATAAVIAESICSGRHDPELDAFSPRRFSAQCDEAA